MSRLRAFGPAHLGLLLPWVVVVVAARRSIRDNSFLWHVTAGSIQLERGSVLTADPFSFTFERQAWRTQSWLAELAYGFLDEKVGLAFVPWMIVLVASLVVISIGLVVFRVSRSVSATATMGVASVWTAVVFLGPRPVLISFALFGLVILAGRDSRLRWTRPLVVWIWAAIHASFPIGIGYLVLDGIRRRDRRAAVDVSASLAVTVGTAHGIGVLEFLTGFAANREALSLLSEWSLPNVISVRFLFIVPALLLMFVGAERGNLRSRDLWTIGPMLVFMFTSTRAVFPAWIGLAPFIGSSLGGWQRPDRVGRPVFNGVLAAAIAVTPFAIPLDGGLDADRFPVALEAELRGSRLFHDDVVGGYLIYAFQGDLPVFVDDRAELFGVEHFRDVITVRSGKPGWEALLDQWTIGRVLIRDGEGLVVVLREAGWLELSRGGGFVLFQRP